MSVRAKAGVLLGFVLLLACPGARADYEETESRLKSAGVDAALRTRIHAAIERCVAYLAKQQKAEGHFEEVFHEDGDGKARAGNTLGVSLLCTLALRHAGTKPSTEPVAKAVAWLFDAKGTHAEGMETKVYEGGIALMLLHAIGRPGPEAPRIASGLARGLDGKCAWWGYDTPGAGNMPAGTEPNAFRADVPNLSTAQFAALGLWAARRMGIDTPPGVWRQHAESLLMHQSKRGSWKYGIENSIGLPSLPKGASADMTQGYFTGTCMGLANLLLARQALKGPPSAPAELMKRLDAAIASARACLQDDALTFLEDPGAGDIHQMPDVVPGGIALPATRIPMHRVGFGPYYSLYALEKACLFADIEAFEVAAPSAEGKAKSKKRPKKEKFPWYATAAEWLLSVQEEDGGWSVSAGGTPKKRSNVVDSALALLILVRSPMTAHPTTPREVDARPSGDVTPGAGK